MNTKEIAAVLISSKEKVSNRNNEKNRSLDSDQMTLLLKLTRRKELVI